MRTILMGTAMVAVLTSAAIADDSVMASRFGNTTITKDAAGNETHLYYGADHTFTVKAGGQTTNGTWKVDGATVCLTYANAAILPPGTANPTCVPVAAHNVGDSWTAGPYTVSLVSGIQ